MRISVQLVKVADGYHLWSQTYDRTLEDIFAVQDDIAQSVVKELRAALLEAPAAAAARTTAVAEVRQAATGRSDNPEAFRLYLQGKFFAERNVLEVEVPVLQGGASWVATVTRSNPARFRRAWTSAAISRIAGQPL